MMKIHTSRSGAEPIYTPAFKPLCWNHELDHQEYGLVNFFSINGTMTHYHNWSGQLVEAGPLESQAARRVQDCIIAYTDSFLKDLENQSVNLLDPTLPEREPKAIPMSTNDGGS